MRLDLCFLPFFFSCRLSPGPPRTTSTSAAAALGSNPAPERGDSLRRGDTLRCGDALRRGAVGIAECCVVLTLPRKPASASSCSIAIWAVTCQSTRLMLCVRVLTCKWCAVQCTCSDHAYLCRTRRLLTAAPPPSCKRLGTVIHSKRTRWLHVLDAPQTTVCLCRLEHELDSRGEQRPPPPSLTFSLYR
jgi:hypothetical protein